MEYRIMTPTEEKVENIKNELEQFIDTCLATNEDAESKTLKVKAKYNADTIDYRVRVKLAEILRRDITIPDATVFDLTVADIHGIYSNYLSLISWINTSISYAPNKVEFLSFACISVRAFQNLIDNGKPDVKQECLDIDNDLLNLTLSAAERGQIKESSGKMRLKGKSGVGHSFVEIGDAESLVDKVQNQMNAEQFRYELDATKVLKELIDKKKK